jgi:hypothetical protein
MQHDSLGKKNWMQSASQLVSSRAKSYTQEIFPQHLSKAPDCTQKYLGTYEEKLGSSL